MMSEEELKGKICSDCVVYTLFLKMSELLKWSFLVISIIALSDKGTELILKIFN